MTGLLPLLSATTNPAGIERALAERAVAYAPSPELYSNGLAKNRFLLLPAGERVDNSNREAWRYPVGTIFVKTFFDDRPIGTSRPVETRIIRHGTDRFEPFEYAVYRWNEAGSEASLLDIAGNNRTPTMVSIAGRTVPHTIPSRNDCGECHNKNALVASNIIGFDELRLNRPARTGETVTQLELLSSAGIFSAPVPPLPRTIADPDPVLRKVKTFVFGNCVHCHHGQQGIVDLRPGVFVANTIGKPPESPGIAAPDGWARVVAGAPEKSLVYLQTRGGALPQGLRAMPQVGVDARELPEFLDELDAMKTWISSLRPN